MSRAIAAILAVVWLGAAHAQPAERGLVTAKQFWDNCDDRANNQMAKLWCYTFVQASIDALLAISSSLGTKDRVCLKGRNPPQVVEAVIAEIPKNRSALFDAGLIVQIGISKALDCGTYR